MGNLFCEVTLQASPYQELSEMGKAMLGAVVVGTDALFHSGLASNDAAWPQQAGCEGRRIPLGPCFAFSAHFYLH